MSVTSAQPSVQPRPARPVKRPRGEGQWALGHREPLNPNERTKKDDDGLNVRARIETIYAHRGFASIDPADLRGRMRWWGLYTQRRPGIDGGRTAMLEPHELDDEYFMLRIRIDGGQLDLAQLRAIAEVSTQYGRDTADITDRQNVQLHWVRIEDVPAIWQALEAVGLSTAEACGDTPRVVLGSPVAGISADEVLDPTPAIREIVERYVGDKAYSNLPRKFKSVDLLAARRAVPGQRHLVPRRRCTPSTGPGFDLWVGGGLSTNPMLAQRLGAWVPLDEVPEVWAGVVGVFRDYGYRRLRSRARLKFLVADWGVQRFREVLEGEYLDRKLIDGPAPELPAHQIDHIGVHRQRDGRFYVGVAPVAGRVSGTHAGAGRRHRRGARQRPGAPHAVPEAPRARRRRGRGGRRSSRSCATLGLEADAVGLAARHDGLHRHRVLQARHRRDQGARGRGGGAPGASARRPRHRHHHQRQRLPERLRPHPGRRHRPQGTVGARARTATMVEGFQIHLGGGLTMAAGPERRVRPQAARPQDDRR